MKNKRLVAVGKWDKVEKRFLIKTAVNEGKEVIISRIENNFRILPITLEYYKLIGNGSATR